MKGIYCLMIDVNKDTMAGVGALGEIKFRKGKYAYIGSAQNGIEKRVKRHLSKNKKVRWHIDYLLSDKHTKVEKVFYRLADKKEECKTARSFHGFGKPIKGFGCSDCRCNSHLFRIKSSRMIEGRKWKILN